jgi:hypothetical protein
MPEPIGQERRELHGDEAHLRRQLHSLHPPVLEIVRQPDVEEDDRFPREQPVLRATE